MERFILLICLLALPATANELQVKPRLCIQHAGRPCTLNLTASWQADTKACLYKQDQPTSPLLCRQQARDVSLSLALEQDTQLVLKSAQTGEVLASQRVRLLRVDLQSGEQLLNQSRSGWGLHP